MKRSRGWPLSLSLISFSVLSLDARAGDLKSPFELESTAVLPAGVRNPRVKNLFMEVDDRFNALGKPEALGLRLNKPVGWAEVLASAPDPVLAQAVLLNKGISTDGSVGAGTTLGTIKVAAQVTVPVLAWGLTPKLTIAWAFPIMSIQTQTDTGFRLSSDGESFLQGVNDVNHYKAAELVDKLNTAVNTKLQKLGYSPVSSEKFTRLGDIKMIGKYMAYDSDRINVAVRGEITFPSGRAPQADKVVDVPTGDGQTDWGGAGIVDGPLPVRGLRWNSYAGFTYQTAARLERRVPLKAGDPLSADKETLDRKLGNLWTSGAGVSYSYLPFGLNFGAGYHFQYLGATRYKPGQFAVERYRLLENESPSQQLQSLSLTAAFSSVEWYRQKQFVYPFQTAFSYNRPLAGKNATTNSIWAAELVAFF